MRFSSNSSPSSFRLLPVFLKERKNEKKNCHVILLLRLSTHSSIHASSLEKPVVSCPWWLLLHTVQIAQISPSHFQEETMRSTHNNNMQSPGPTNNNHACLLNIPQWTRDTKGGLVGAFSCCCIAVSLLHHEITAKSQTF